MNQAAGAKQRIIERNQYDPSKQSKRKTRVVSKRGATQTYKKKGDLIIDSMGRVMEVEKDGWY